MNSYSPCLLAVTVGCALAYPVAPALALDLSSPRVGHIFDEGEAIVFNVSGTTAEVTYTVSEVEGAYTATGTAPAASPLPITVPHRGLYELEVSLGVDKAETRFAVVFPQGAGLREGVGMFFTDVADVPMAENMGAHGLHRRAP